MIPLDQGDETMGEVPHPPHQEAEHPVEEQEESADGQHPVCGPLPDARERVERNEAEGRGGGDGDGQEGRQMAGVEGGVPRRAHPQPPAEEIPGLPEEDHGHQTAEHARQNAVQSPEVAQQDRQSDVHRRLGDRGSDVGEEAVGVEVGIDRQAREVDVEDGRQQRQRQVIEQVFGSHPERDEGRSQRIDAEAGRAAEQEPGGEELFEDLQDPFPVAFGHEVAHAGVHAVEQGAHEGGDSGDDELVVSVEGHQAQRGVGVDDYRGGLRQGESSDLVEEELPDAGFSRIADEPDTDASANDTSNADVSAEEPSSSASPAADAAEAEKKSPEPVTLSGQLVMPPYSVQYLKAL